MATKWIKITGTDFEVEFVGAMESVSGASKHLSHRTMRIFAAFAIGRIGRNDK